jgi:transcription elongation factor S-II
MDRREILSKGASLQKAINAKEPSENILTILRDLKTNVKPSEELLRATGIGKIVNKVKGIQGLDPEVGKLAAEIISRWRHVVNEQKLASGTSTPIANGARSNGTSSPAPQAKSASPTGVAPDKRNWKVDKVPRDDLVPDDKARNNCIGLIYDGLCLGSDLPMKTILDLAKQIESAALNLPDARGSSASPAYKEKIRSLFQNLKNKSNPKLRIRILSGEISAQRFVTMSHEEMKSRQQKEMDSKIAKENMNNAMVAQEEKSVSTSLECGKCHQKKVSYSQAQTRSADEPMTTFCECLHCGNRWKFS